jgi:hypothetical protein
MDERRKVVFVTRRPWMFRSYDVTTGLLVALIIFVMMIGAFGRSHP